MINPTNDSSHLHLKVVIKRFNFLGCAKSFLGDGLVNISVLHRTSMEPSQIASEQANVDLKFLNFRERPKTNSTMIVRNYFKVCSKLDIHAIRMK